MLNKAIEVENELKDKFKEIDQVVYINSEKVLSAFHKELVQASDFNGTTGYGYGDIGRDKLEKIYADIFHCERALVRAQFVSGTHALTVGFFGILRPGDTLLSITGLPYDTLHKVIGIVPNESSLISFGINYKYIDLVDNDFDYDKISKSLENVRVIHIQRSIGYSDRETLSIEKIEKVIRFIKEINKEIIVFVDNCYCEFCTELEPTDVGADLVIGSLIKNLGAGIANNGAYIVGKEELVELCSERLTSPGLGSEVGSSLSQNRNFYEGLYLAPRVVGNALKVKLFTSLLCKKLGFNVINENTNDIVLGIVFNNENKLINYVKAIQEVSAIDAHFSPVPSDMPGYDSQIIMASGSFTDGSSIELSCDAPIREPFIAYQQGSLTYEYGKMGVIKALEKVCEDFNE